jgi:uncharacterized protein (DUF697 family)
LKAASSSTKIDLISETQLLKSKKWFQKRYQKEWEHAKIVSKLALGLSDHKSKEREDALLIVRRYTTLSVFGGLIPVPYLDVVALTGLQLRMLSLIASIYGAEFTKSTAKIAVTSLLLGVPQGLSQSLFQRFMLSTPFIKVIPGFGTLAGDLAMASFGATATYAIGVVFIDHFESGGTLLDFEAQNAIANFEAQMLIFKQNFIKKTSFKERWFRKSEKL